MITRITIHLLCNIIYIDQEHHWSLRNSTFHTAPFWFLLLLFSFCCCSKSLPFISSNHPSFLLHFLVSRTVSCEVPCRKPSWGPARCNQSTLPFPMSHQSLSSKNLVIQDFPPLNPNWPPKNVIVYSKNFNHLSFTIFWHIFATMLINDTGL